ncbi:substrate-binding periplasmic protein [Ferrovibrio sp.]|uniref:substrate-binding periplasmic protein n=1 Tax=Ferrovibrio sp. TaxID=1917215 RepID=UPI003D097DBE
MQQLLLIFSALMFCFGVRPVAAEELRVVYLDVAVSPYLMGSGPDMATPPGLAVDLLREAAGADFSLSFRRITARRIIDEVRFGRADVILGMRATPDRLADLRFPMRDGAIDRDRWMVRLTQSFYRLEGGALQWDGRHLKPAGAIVGIPSGMALGGLLRDLGADVVEFSTTKQLFGMLAAGRFSAVATLDIVGDSFAGSVNGRRIEKMLPVLEEADFYMPVSPAYYARHSGKVEALWHRMTALRNATYARLLPKYLE